MKYLLAGIAKTSGQNAIQECSEQTLNFGLKKKLHGWKDGSVAKNVFCTRQEDIISNLKNPHTKLGMDPHVPITAALVGGGDAGGLLELDDCHPRPQSSLASLNNQSNAHTSREKYRSFFKIKFKFMFECVCVQEW